MDLGSRAPTLNVQVVLFENPLTHVWRLLEGLSASVEQAKRENILSEATLAIGDCSTIPILNKNDLADLKEHATANGLAGLTYDFFDENLGHSGGQNRLAGDTNPDILLFLNPDTYPAPNMLRELLPHLGQANVGLVEARQMPLEHPKEFDPLTGETSWASCCCAAMEADMFRSVNGFDAQNFPVYCNDVDLSWRLRLAGYRVLSVATAVVFHDKKISPSGHPIPTASEPFYSALGRLLLATRYDRKDILDETMVSIEAEGQQAQLAAIEEFQRRQQEGRLPDVITNADKVAQFIGGEYARHRF